jgi:hypothetical protein
MGTQPPTARETARFGKQRQEYSNPEDKLNLTPPSYVRLKNDTISEFLAQQRDFLQISKEEEAGANPDSEHQPRELWELAGIREQLVEVVLGRFLPLSAAVGSSCGCSVVRFGQAACGCGGWSVSARLAVGNPPNRCKIRQIVAESAKIR